MKQNAKFVDVGANKQTVNNKATELAIAAFREHVL